ncbi:hypothetical protein B0H14DRAFT_3559487 [Mycena olivaceomarginata]|nr:hypothetical protein B0H14DRAFT_3559487 [Mycena olivaceomarginata]
MNTHLISPQPARLPTAFNRAHPLITHPMTCALVHGLETFMQQPAHYGGLTSLVGWALISAPRCRPTALRLELAHGHAHIKSYAKATPLCPYLVCPLEAPRRASWPVLCPIARCASHVHLSSTLEVHTRQYIKRPPPSLAHVQIPAPSVGAILTFSLNDVDRRLRTQGAGRRSQMPVRPHTQNGGDLDGDADNHWMSLDELEEVEEEEEEGLVAELVELLATLPKEVVILGQAWKIAGHALEKVLAPVQELAGLEPVVRIQRALICELPTFFITDQQLTQRSPHTQTLEEGTLVASTSRSTKAFHAGSGVTTVLTAHTMIRH